MAPDFFRLFSSTQISYIAKHCCRNLWLGGASDRENPLSGALVVVLDRQAEVSALEQGFLKCALQPIGELQPHVQWDHELGSPTPCFWLAPIKATPEELDRPEALPGLCGASTPLHGPTEIAHRSIENQLSFFWMQLMVSLEVGSRSICRSFGGQ